MKLAGSTAARHEGDMRNSEQPPPIPTHPADILPAGARVRLGTNRLNHIVYRSANDGICCLAFSPDGRYLVGVGYDDDEATLWELPSGREMWRWVSGPETPWGTNRGVGGAAFSPDNRLLAINGWGTMIFEVATGKMVKALDSGTSAYWGLAFSPCGRYLAQTEHTGVLVYTVDTWEIVTRLEDDSPYQYDSDKDRFEAITFSPDGQLLAAPPRLTHPG